MKLLESYIPQDRRIALARGEILPDHVYGSALFADISGFTPLCESLAQSLGMQRGAEELAYQLNHVYDELISQVHNYHGSVIGFAGDAITCWFDETTEENLSVSGQRSSVHATACALAMQNAMRAFPHLAIKIGIATGPARRFMVGDPSIQLIDTLAGETIRQMAQAEALAEKGEIVLAPSTVENLPDMWIRGRSVGNFIAITQLTTPIEPAPWDESQDDVLTQEQIRPWVLRAFYEHITAGHERFTTELRGATALFAQFEEIDYDHDLDAGYKLDAYIRHAQDIVNRHEGNLIQLTIGEHGSFFYAVFGALVAHDDDPGRAVKAALALQFGTSASLVSASSANQAIMTQRIGIAQGQMRVGTYGAPIRNTYGAIGDATNLAARLMQSASACEIRCDYNVYRLASKRIAFEALPPIRVKGKAGLVRIYRPLLEQLTKGTQTQGNKGKIVGRRAEIAVVEKTLDQVTNGATRVLIIEGEAGIGKSRLVDEVKRLTREHGMTWLIGNGQSIEQQTPYRVWRDIFYSYFDIENITDASERRARVESSFVHLLPEDAQRLPVLDDVLGLGIPENMLTQSLTANLRQQNVTIVLTALLRAWTNEHPLVLILEDAHWLDSLSWELALQVVRALALSNAPLLLVLANRPLENGAGQKILAQLSAMETTQAIALDALAPDEIIALIANRLNVGVDALPASLVELVQLRAHGNPFFAEELVFNLRDTGILVAHNSHITLSQDLSQSIQTIPDTLYGLILSRIDRLPSQRQFIIKVAAVMGRAFAFTPLHHVVNQYITMMDESLKEHLLSLTKADFTFLEALEPELTYLFKHIITQEAAYQTLLFSQRRELHRIVAEWYESRDEGAGHSEQNLISDLRTLYPLLAYHYRYAEDVKKERYYARLAGELAASQFANDAAISYLSRALELTDAEDDATRCALLLAREAIYHVQGKRQAQIADLEMLTQSHQPTIQAQVSLRRAKLESETGNYTAALAHAQEIINATQDLGLQVAGMIEWGRVLARLAQYPGASAHLTQALTLAQSGGLDSLQADCLHSMGMVFSEQGNYVLARNYLEQALAIRRGQPGLQGEGSTLHALGNVAIFQADYERASEYYRNAISIFRQIGARPEECNTSNNLGTVALYRGDYGQAASYYTQALGIARETGGRRSESNALGNLGIVARYQGEYEQAIRYTEQALAIDRAIGHRQGVARKFNSLGEIARMQGDYARAQSYFAQSLDMTRELGERRSESITLGNLGLVALYVQDYATALTCYEPALVIARELGDRDRMGYTLTGLAEALAGLGQLENAVTTMQEAIAVRRQVGQLALVMESVAGLAQIYLTQNKLDLALTASQEILAYWDKTHSLDAANEPIQILLTCYRVLAANHRPRTTEILEMTFNRVCQHLARIPNPVARLSVLENVVWYQEIVTAFAQNTSMPIEQVMNQVINPLPETS
jgi:class 3 adenylate cyclase/tetratricopeptide (TPR) repeat protein